MSARPRGIKVVRKTLADGSVKEYRYDRAAIDAKRRHAERAEGISILADGYRKTPEFRGLSPRWQRAMMHYVGILERELGWMTLDDLSDREARNDFYELRDRLADLPAKADKTMNVLRALLNYGYERNKLQANQAYKIPKLSRDGKRRDKIWRQEHIDAFMGAATPSVQRLFLFALYTLARQSDVARIRFAEMYDGKWLSFQPNKTKHSTGVWVHLPVFALDPLREMVGAGELLTETGKHWTSENIKREMRLTKARAGLEGADLTFHDIRGTGITHLFEAGCSEAETASISGHSIGAGSKIGDYTSRSKTFALHAYQKWNAAMQGGADVIRLATGSETVETSA